MNRIPRKSSIGLRTSLGNVSKILAKQILDEKGQLEKKTRDDPNTTLNETTTMAQTNNLTQTESTTYEVVLDPTNALKYFPAANVKFTNVSLYSSTPLEQSNYIANILLSYFSMAELKTKTITDATACIGGNVWSFAKLLNVNAIELDPVNKKVLDYNIKILNLRNVKTYLADYLDICYQINQDIIFIDPPWGGLDYKKNKCFDLYLGDQSISSLVNGYLSYLSSMIILKVPCSFLGSIRSAHRYIDYITVSSNTPLYKLIILSHRKKIKPIQYRTFQRVDYRKLLKTT